MRDALSLLDQVLALTGGDVSQEAVRRVLGLVEEERYLELLDILLEHRHGEVFTFVEALLDEGYDMVEFHRGWWTPSGSSCGSAWVREREVKGVREDLRESFEDRAGRSLSRGSGSHVGPGHRAGGHGESPTKCPSPASAGDAPPPAELSGSNRGAGKPPQGIRGEEEAPPPEQRVRSSKSVSTSGPGAPRREPGRRRKARAPSPPSSLQEAWEKTLESPVKLPAGVLPFLRAARVEFPEDGGIRLAVPPGPGLDRLQDPVTQRLLKEAVGSHSGSAPELTVLADGMEAGPAARITEGTVRDGRLRELVEKEPTLGEAVKELDLELLD